MQSTDDQNYLTILFYHFIFVNDDMLVMKYSEMLLHDFRMANFGWEMADG